MWCHSEVKFVVLRWKLEFEIAAKDADGNGKLWELKFVIGTLKTVTEHLDGDGNKQKVPENTFRAAIQRDNKSFDANASEWPNTGDTVHWTCGRNQKSDKFMWGCWFIYTCCRSLPVCWLLEMGSSPLTCFRGDNIWVMRRAGQKRDAANFQPIRPHLSSAEIGYSCLIPLSLMLIILGAFRMDQ